MLPSLASIITVKGKAKKLTSPFLSSCKSSAEGWSCHPCLKLISSIPLQLVLKNMKVQDESSFLQYIQTTDKIQLHHNRSAIFRHRLLLYLALYKAAYYALLSADIFSLEQRTVAYNAFYQLTSDRRVNLNSSFFSLMLAYLQYQFYFVSNRPLNQLLVDVLHRRRYDFFIWGSHRERDLGEYIRHFYLSMGRRPLS